MGIVIRLIFLVLLGCTNTIYALEADVKKISPGMAVDDFSLPAVKGWGQRLAEVHGKPVMLIWLDSCDRCEEKLAKYQLLAESLVSDGLVTWFIWSAEDDNRPPRMRLPVLISDKHWATGWRFESRPAVMLISPEGILDHLLLGDLEDRFDQSEIIISRWLNSKNEKSLNLSSLTQP